MRGRVMRALDLFCGAGGASMGLHQAGFEVVGVDAAPQANYPFEFVQGDVLELNASDIAAYDLIWASPPCQAFTAYKRRPNHVKPSPDLIEPTRKLLESSGVPYIIENVGGAPLRYPVMLCGSMFGLDVRRHRYFECSFPVLTPQCEHDRQAPRFPMATNRTNLRRTVEIGSWRIPLETQRQAMGIDWMSREELSQAVPPAYAEWLCVNLATN